MQTIHEPFSVIIPTYNEEASIGTVVRRLARVSDTTGCEYEITVVDDGSSDQTAQVAEKAGAHVLCHQKNKGYGAALKTGINAALYEYIVIVDGDATYPIEPIPEMLRLLESADMVVASRTGQNVSSPLLRRPARWILRKLAGYITGEHIPDLNSGLRAFRRQCVLQYFSILPDKFSFTTTITVAMLSDGYKVTYIPVDYYQRVGKSKIVSWDFINFVTLVLRLSMLFQPLKVFVPVALLSLMLGLGKFILDIVLAFQRVQEISLSLISQPIVSTTSVIFLLSALQILLIGMMSDGIARKISQRMPSQYQSSSVLKNQVESPANTGSLKDIKYADKASQQKN